MRHLDYGRRLLGSLHGQGLRRVVIVVLVALSLWSFGAWHTSAESSDNQPGLSGATLLDIDATTIAAMFTVPLPAAQVDDNRYLELVNADHPITAAPAPELLSPVSPTAVGSAKAKQLHHMALAAVDEMFAAALIAAIGTFHVSSGYRNYADQQRVYDDTADKAYVQPPGHSEHETGLAADIMADGVAQSALATSAPGRWLASNAWKYGLVLRYPAGKQNVTGIAYEAWHFRYLGQPHAWYCTQSNLTLEEYIRSLQGIRGFAAGFGDRTYYVLYERPANDKIMVPPNLDYNISNDNTGGYIVTAWK